MAWLWAIWKESLQKKKYNQHSSVFKQWSLANLRKITFILLECHRSINKFKKPSFWPIFGAKRFFSKKSGLATHNNTNTMLSFRKKLMSQSQENFQTERRKDGQTPIHRPGVQKILNWKWKWQIHFSNNFSTDFGCFSYTKST